MMCKLQVDQSLTPELLEDLEEAKALHVTVSYIQVIQRSCTSRITSM